MHGRREKRDLSAVSEDEENLDLGDVVDYDELLEAFQSNIAQPQFTHNEEKRFLGKLPEVQFDNETCYTHLEIRHRTEQFRTHLCTRLTFDTCTSTAHKLNRYFPPHHPNDSLLGHRLFGPQRRLPQFLLPALG